MSQPIAPPDHRAVAGIRRAAPAVAFTGKWTILLNIATGCCSQPGTARYSTDLNAPEKIGHRAAMNTRFSSTFIFVSTRRRC
jgi:hypothetical protein